MTRTLILSNVKKLMEVIIMAVVCEKCGKKIDMLSKIANEYMKLDEKISLCFECAEPIQNKVEKLRYIKSKTEFELSRAEILENCNTLYNDSIIKALENKIEHIYINTVTEKLEDSDVKKHFIESYMITTGYDFNGYKIKKYMGIISSQVVLGTGFLSEFSASFADIFGEESNKFAEKLETAKNAALEKLIIKSVDKGGNAIIGIDFDYITFHGNMIGVVANGTNVVIEEDK